MATLGSVERAVEQLRRLAPGGDAVEPLIPLLHNRGFSQREIAARLELSQTTVSRRLRILVSLGLCDPIDLSAGGGANHQSSEQVKSARAFRLATQGLIKAQLDRTAPHERDLVRGLIADPLSDVTEILASWPNRERAE